MNGLEFEDIEAALGANVHLVIPQSFDVSRTGNRGVPIVDDLPKHPVSVAVRKLANMQRGLKGQQVGAIDTRKARGGGFFRRGK
jgi:pilus assembly protein CpaE